VSDELIYVSRLVRLPLLGLDGAEIGRIADVVVNTTSEREAPRVNGFVIEVQRRRVFLGAGRVGEIDSDGARMRRAALNPHPFALRPGEILIVGELFGRKVRRQEVIDVGIRPTPGVSYAWEVATVALGTTNIFGRPRTREVVEWTEAGELFQAHRPIEREAAAIGLLHPAEMAEAIRKLPLERRRVLADLLEDDRLADLLEELDEDDQIRIVEGLDLERVGRVLDEMEADDAADLLGELPLRRRDEILRAMTPDEADPVRRLLDYRPDTAGGLMTPEPLIMPPTATVAEALARIRDPDLPPALAAQVFVTAPPNETPTGRYLGVVGYQRLLRETPPKPLARCLDDQPDPVPVNASEREVAATVAAYDVVAVPVTDSAGRLVGAVTIDDILDQILPDDWRER
jgi:CBS domain-containing protein/sporulation protein YlmC with PRC-barrel domain